MNDEVTKLLQLAHEASLHYSGNTPELLVRARAGDEVAKRELVEGLLELVLLMGLRMKPEGWAELDAMQEANFALVREIESRSSDLIPSVALRLAERFSYQINELTMIRADAPLDIPIVERLPETSDPETRDWPGRWTRSVGTALLRASHSARWVFELMHSEAALLNYGYVGTCHVLLALFGEPETDTYLRAAGLSHESADAAIQETLGFPALPTQGQLPLTPRAKEALELAVGEAGTNDLRPADILIGLLMQRESLALTVMNSLGADVDELLLAVRADDGERPDDQSD